MLRPAGHERADADHRLAICGGLCRQLVWKGEVSTAQCATGSSPADYAGLNAFFAAGWLTRLSRLDSTVRLGFDLSQTSSIQVHIIYLNCLLDICGRSKIVQSKQSHTHLNGLHPFQGPVFCRHECLLTR